MENHADISQGNKIDNCQICGNSDLELLLSLGHHPPTDNFLSKSQLKEPETHYPLDLNFCGDCKLVQLGYAVNPSVLFTDSFIYTTGSSGELVKNFQSLVKGLVGRFDLSSSDLAIDIGSNDGTLLANYLPFGVKILGIDPSRAAKLATERGIPTLDDFFNKDTAGRVLGQYGGARIITAANVFAHVRDLDSFMKGVHLLLPEDGIFIEESHYLGDLISKGEYDSIYAEHLRYYSLRPLIHLFDKFGMDVFDAEKIETHGGSLRVYACKKGTLPISDNIQKILGEEEVLGLYDRQTYEDFSERVLENRQKLRSMLFGVREEGKRIVGIGAPAKGNTLLNFCGIGREILDFLVEKPNLKIGMYTPGTHIRIAEETEMFLNPPEYALLLSWNLKEIIVPKIRGKGFEGGIIVPVPEPYILN